MEAETETTGGAVRSRENQRREEEFVEDARATSAINGRETPTADEIRRISREPHPFPMKVTGCRWAFSFSEQGGADMELHYESWKSRTAPDRSPARVKREAGSKKSRTWLLREGIFDGGNSLP